MKDIQKCFIVLTCGFWGKGETIQAAANACLKSGGKRSQTVAVYLYVADENDCNPQIPLIQECVCDDSGGIHYPQFAKSIRLFGPSNSCVKLGGLLK